MPVTISSATSRTSAATPQMVRREPVEIPSIIGKPNTGAGPELHKRAAQGANAHLACHEPVIITQAIDFQRFFRA
jgi:hypothetical protein